jgi:hypothetical protein
MVSIPPGQGEEEPRLSASPQRSSGKCNADLTPAPRKIYSVIAGGNIPCLGDSTSDDFNKCLKKIPKVGKEDDLNMNPFLILLVHHT